VDKRAVVYLTAEEYLTICNAADRVGLSLTAYLRTCALERALAHPTAIVPLTSTTATTGRTLR